MSKMFFNRLHLNINDNRPKKPFIIDGIKSVASEGFNNYSYKIVEVEVKGSYIKGYLVKYDPYGRGEVVDESTGTVKKGGMVNNIVAKSLFLVNIDEMIIAFEEVKNVISKTMFVRIFTNLFKNNHKGQNFEFFISSISEKYSFIEKAKKLTNIKRVSIRLVPSNPNNADLWRATDERMRDNGITKYREIQESSSDAGILLDNETIAKMAMSEDGYGFAEATGYDQQGDPITISTAKKSQEVTHTLPYSIEKSGIDNIINYLSSTFDKIKKRTNHQE
ncbi:DUF4747 family protein [Flavobacterium tistrianum]|uniref:DUF4747 family protein n=1 Tax=Flavobacterium tistrianum TaxID=1685414 RepID=UPI000DADF160|nr:DUF4747 family protein [Flavobacterium tistrianum]KAF2341571.1 DUF4747 family protein [Flavobacterium tistrianum]